MTKNQENQRRRNSNKLSGQSSATLITLVVCFILSISMVSAFEFDNRKYSRDTTFDGKNIAGDKLLEKYAPIEIKNMFGLGKTHFEGYLSQHDDVCGQDCKSTMEIKLNEDGVLVDDVIFETLVDGSWIEQSVRSYQFSYWGDIDDYKTQCIKGKEIINGTSYTPEECTQIKVGSHKGWVDYQIGQEVKAGLYTLKLDVEKKPSRTVDWKIITHGEILDAWAVFNGVPTVYDEIDDSSIDTNLWNTETVGPSGGMTPYITEDTDNIYLRATGGSSTGITSETLTSSNISSLDFLSITLNVQVGASSDNYNGGYGRLTIFGNIVKTVTTSGSDTSVWTILKNESTGSLQYDIYDDDVYQETITPSDDEIELYAYQKVFNAFTYSRGYARLYYVYYNQSNVILNSPENNHISDTSEVQFNCSAEVTGGATIENMSLWTNESGSWEIVETLHGDYSIPLINDTTDHSETTSGSWDVIKMVEYNISDYIEYINHSWMKGGYNTVTMYIDIIFNYTDGTTETVDISFLEENGVWKDYNSNNPQPSKKVEKVEFWASFQYHDVTIHLKDIAIIGKPSNFTQTITDTTLWTCQACDSDGDCGFATENRTVSVDTNAPTISIESPVGILNYGAIGNQETLNVTFNDSNLDSCWYNYNGTNVSLGCLTGVKNSTTFTLEDNYNMTIYTNDSVGNMNSSFIEWEYKVLENNRTHNSSSFETARETFSINLTANNSLTAVTLNYNGTEYTTTQSGDIWSYSMDIPTTVYNNSIYWKFTYGDTINSYTSYQNISETIFTLCNATYSDDYLNVTFKDEADLSVLNASVTTSTFEYYLGSGTVTKTYNLINNTDNLNYLFCATPNKTLHVNPYVQYKRDADYPQRIWDAVVQDYTSSLTTQILYLLESADGIYVTIQVINSANQLISGVDITATREIGGVDTVVAFGTTGDAGTVTFWLNPDFLHVFDLSKEGLTDYSTSLIPTQTSYTITMGGATETENSTIQGITKSILPTNSYLVNDTEYTFGFTLDSSYWDVSDYGFDLRLSNGTIITGDNTGTEGTALTKLYDVNNQSIIYLDYYWVINDVYTNSTVHWIIQNTENTQWSIAVFFEDLNAYIDSGIYGLDNFGKNLLIFLILFISVGIMSYKYGVASPLAVSSMMFGIIFFFDIVVGLIPAIRGVEHLLTYLSALILTLSIFNEVRT